MNAKILTAILLCCIPATLQAQACIIETGEGNTRVKVCQQNRTIPADLFAGGFCQPQLAGQVTMVTMLEHCPPGAFGICRSAQTAGTQIPYQQDIYYYGQPTDARFLKPACQQQSSGSWQQFEQTDQH